MTENEQHLPVQPILDEASEVVWEDPKKRFARENQPLLRRMAALAPTELPSDAPPAWFTERKNPYPEQRSGNDPDFEMFPHFLPKERVSWLEDTLDALAEDGSLDEDDADTLRDALACTQWAASLHERWLQLGTELLSLGAHTPLLHQLGLPLLSSGISHAALTGPTAPLYPDCTPNKRWMIKPLSEFDTALDVLDRLRAETRQQKREIERLNCELANTRAELRKAGHSDD